MKSKMLPLIVVLCIFSVFISGCSQGTTEEMETTIPPPEVSAIAEAPEVSATVEEPKISAIAETPEASSAPEVSSLPAVEEPEETTPVEQAIVQAGETFSDGYQVYLYDPQPKAVSAARLNGSYKVSYILSEDAANLSGVMTVIKYVDLDGNKEIKSGVNSDFPGIETGSGTGYFTFNRALGAVYDQCIDDAFEKDGMDLNHVEPAYIEVVLVGLTQGGVEISNTLQIQVEPLDE